MVIYLDTETTGLYPGNICQLSLVMQDKNGTTAKNYFFTVDSVEYGAYMVHGFSVEKLKELSNGKRFCDFANEIYNCLNGANLLVGHNIAFDIGFLRKEFESCGMELPSVPTFCTMKTTVPLCQIPRSSHRGYKYPRLNELCSFFALEEKEIDETMAYLFNADASFHDARFDTVAVYLICNKAKNRIDCFDKIGENV